MSPRPDPNLDDLLSDRLIQAVMRADRVDPHALRAMLAGVTSRVARRRAAAPTRPAVSFFSVPRLEWRPDRGAATAPASGLPTAFDAGCAAGACC